LNASASIDGHDVDAVDRADDAKNRRRAHTRDRKPISAKVKPERQHRQGARRTTVGTEEIQFHVREALGWTHAPFIPKDVYAAQGTGARRRSEDALPAYKGPFPLAKEFMRCMKGELPAGFNQLAFDTVVAAHSKADDRRAVRPASLALETFTAVHRLRCWRLRRPDRGRLQPH
jgi:transketolase